ncbi:Thiol-disulfide oxidoreductase ResA [Planctomycetes bacterium Pan216]|uniref:Thiol-disulfide oxidoreductase ResA n=1 Tax=Kolteria novifilia TaxID=2527975 RepID=A0A518B3B0_9BACT|nr:Thiol-disulfide oxidoreductase ResA [Planctomycetes bacterium Pan216]
MDIGSGLRWVAFMYGGYWPLITLLTLGLGALLFTWASRLLLRRPPRYVAVAFASFLALAAGMTLGVLMIDLFGTFPHESKVIDGWMYGAAFLIAFLVSGVVLSWLLNVEFRLTLLLWTLECIGMALLNVALLSTVFVGGGTVGGVRFQEDARNLRSWIGKAAPDLSFTTVAGKRMSLASLRGRQVVLDFWATWCPHCRDQIAQLNELATQIPAEQVTVIGISQEPADEVEEFVQEHEFSYPVASVEVLPLPYDLVFAIPTTFFIDERGVIKAIDVSETPLDEMVRQLNEDGWVPHLPSPSRASRLRGEEGASKEAVKPSAFPEASLLGEPESTAPAPKESGATPTRQGTSTKKTSP